MDRPSIQRLAGKRTPSKMMAWLIRRRRQWRRRHGRRKKWRRYTERASQREKKKREREKKTVIRSVRNRIRPAVTVPRVVNKTTTAQKSGSEAGRGPLGASKGAARRKRVGGPQRPSRRPRPDPRFGPLSRPPASHSHSSACCCVRVFRVCRAPRPFFHTAPGVAAASTGRGWWLPAQGEVVARRAATTPPSTTRRHPPEKKVVCSACLCDRQRRRRRRRSTTTHLLSDVVHGRCGADACQAAAAQSTHVTAPSQTRDERHKHAATT